MTRYYDESGYERPRSELLREVGDSDNGRRWCNGDDCWCGLVGPDPFDGRHT